MRRVMINRDLAQQPALEFRKGHRRFSLGVVVIARRHVRSRSTRQKSQFSDHCADQPLDMATQMGRAGFADIRVDAIAHAGPPKRLRAMRLGLIGMQAPEQAEHRVADIHTQVFKHRFLGQQRARDRPAAPENRRIAEADIIAEYRTGPDFNQERDPRPSELFPPQAVDQDNVPPGMVHLDKIEETIAAVFPRVRFMRAAGLGAHAGLGPHTARNLGQQPLDCLLARDQIGGKPVLSVICMEQAPYLPSRFSAVRRHHLKRDLVGQRINGASHHRVDPM